MIRSRYSVVTAAALFLGTVVVPLTLAGPAAAAVTTGPFTLDINNREDVRDFYNTVHEAANGVPDGWTGSIAGCNPGTVSPDYLAATLSRINYFRTMAGEPDVTFTDALNTEAQAAALIQSANDSLNHHPPSTGTGSTCWTQAGADGSAASNLAIGNAGPAAIDQLMYDHVNTSFPGGGASGHRRNSLNPSITTMGSGSIPATPGFNATEANIVLTTPSATRPPVRTGFIAWPPAGFVPYQVVYPRWSFSLPNGDFSGATVTMQHNGAAVPVQVRCVDPNIAQDFLCGQFSEPAISWTPNGLADGADWPKPAADDPYTVTISNVVVNGVVQAPFTYTVTVIDPTVSDAVHAISQVPTGPATVSVNTNATYTVPAVQDATGYQWRTSSVSAGDIIDGAENGMANFTAKIDLDYTPISTVEASTGTSAFHLRGFGGVSSPTPALQTLTLNAAELATPTSSLSFDSMYRALVNESAQVDVSLDGGANWQPAFAESPPDTQQDSSFTTKTVSLSQFAGHQINLRFSLNYTGGGFSNCCGEPNGWYIDNVALKNVQNAAAPVLSAVGANPSFVLNSAQQGPITVDVRPQFTNASFGNSFGPWSPVKAVNVVGSSGLVTVTSSANPSAQNQSVTFTATVNPTDGGGTVSFTDNGTAIGGCQSLTLTAGKATCVDSFFAGGTEPIVATYSGDGNFAGSTSPTLNQVINAPVPTSGTFTVSPTGVFGGDPVTLTATVSSTDGGGTVSFSADISAIPGCGAVPLDATGQAICTTTFIGPGHPLLDAAYSGDANFLGFDIGHQGILVTARTAMSVVSSANPSAPGDTVTYTATVSPANQSGQIGFTDNGNVIAGPPPQQTCANLDPDVNGSATCTITYPTGGEHAIVANFTAFGGLSSYTSSTSPTLNQSVGGTLTPTATTLASSGNPSLTGQQVTYTATVTGGDLGGTVAFADGGITIAGCDAVAVTAGHATCAQTYTAVGPHLISAAYNGDATSASSAAVTVNQQVNLSPPAAVTTAAVINLGNGAARVTFTAPAAAIHHAIAGSSTPSSATGFNVYQGTSAGKESTTPLNSSRLLATATGYTITGLTTGKKYFFTVKALNARGTTGPASPEVNATPAVAPGAPTSLHATSGKGSARFTWVAPASTGGGKITGYNVYKSTTPGGLKPVRANPAPLGPTTTAYSASALLDGVTYYFTVRALNAVGTSSASNVASVIPASAPGAPNHLTAYRGKASVGLRWIAPDNTGGSAITGFNVYKGTTSGGESTTPVNASPLPATAVSYTATGLTNGTTYFFKVKAVNVVGAGSYSGQASAAAAATAPPPWPASLTAKAGVASAALTWTAPASTGGSAITGYNVYKATSAGGESNTPVNSSPLPATARTFTVTGLGNAVQYYFTVKAVNAIGVGAPSDEASATPAAAATVPGAPVNPKATAGAAKVTVTWATPAWNGGSAITGYNVYKGTTSGGESATPVNATPLSPSTKTLAVTGLTTGKNYYFFVKAINAIGISVPSSQVSAKPS